MYLVSAYFDDITEKRISGYMKQVRKTTGNTLMLDGNVPPHITIASFHTETESDAREIFFRGAESLKNGNVSWVSIGAFLPDVIYIAPVLNEYLHRLSESYSKVINERQRTRIDGRYVPFSWFPHSTLAKRLSMEQLTSAFSVMQNQFAPFEGKVTKIGLSKTNPYVDIEVISLK